MIFQNHCQAINVIIFFINMCNWAKINFRALIEPDIRCALPNKSYYCR